MLINRLRQLTDQKHRLTEEEHDITDEQIEIQAILEAKAREQERTMLESAREAEPEPEPEALPVPAAKTHNQSAKRQGMKTISCEYTSRLCSSLLQGGLDAGSMESRRITPERSWDTSPRKRE